VLVIRGGVLEGGVISDAEVRSLATLPPADLLRAQLLGAVSGPLTTIVGLFTAPLRDFVGVLDARIRQLQEQGETTEPAAEAPPPEEQPAAAEPTSDQSEQEAEEE
jgi:ribosomal protein L10